MAIKIVIDTNIWVSSLLNPKGMPAGLRKLFEKRLIEVVISEPMLEELAEVLNRPRIKIKYGISENDITELLSLIEERAEHCVLSRDVNIYRDRDDDFVIETAIKGKAKYLVTRDDDIKFDKEISKFLLKNGVLVISIAKFLKLINNS